LIAPSIDPRALDLLTRAYGVLLFLTLLQLLPQAQRFLMSESHGGYADRSRWSAALHNPVAAPIVLIAWFSAALGLAVREQVVASALVNLLLCRYYFISMRWKSILRGMGAPGFLSYWTGALVFFLELGARHDPSGRLLEAASFAFRIDLGVIMICAGVYKAVAGYARNDGMERGMINPAWGYWGRFYAPLPPSHWLFRALNHLAYGTEIVAGVLMLFPATQVWGALLIFLSFAWILTHIRLGFLCEMVMAACLVYLPAGHAWASFLPAAATVRAEAMSPAVVSGFVALLYAYVALLPLAKGGQWFNFLARRRLPWFLQPVLERYTNFFGIIIWRVFSVDVTNFYVRVAVEDARGVREPYSTSREPEAFVRYWHVGENICLTSVFTTLKYFESQKDLFRARLTRYARTVPAPPGGSVVFEYVFMDKTGDRFTDRLVAEWTFDTKTGAIGERILDPSFSPSAASPVSPVHEGGVPGSYAPAT
jgi:hypothetical protein